MKISKPQLTADIDRDHNLAFVESEVLVLPRRTGWKVRDQDGRIERSELPRVLTAVFLLLDTNHDEALTGSEAVFLAPAHREEVKPKRTGRSTLDQMTNGCRCVFGADGINHNVVPRPALRPR